MEINLTELERKDRLYLGLLTPDSLKEKRLADQLGR